MKQVQYRLKDKRAMIFQHSIERNSVGSPIFKYRALNSTGFWCYSQNISGDLADNGLVLRNEETRQFVFNFLQISPRDLICYRGKWYEVTRANTTADYNDEVFVYAKDTVTPSEKNFLD